MILSTDEIRSRMAPTTPLEDRLVITPILDWPAQATPGRAGIDVRLGQIFSVPRRTKLDHLDHLDDDQFSRIERYKDSYFIPLGDHFVLHPGQFVLGQTLEWVRLPRSLAGYVLGRSSWGRDGLIIATASGIHCSYSGPITLEITNLAEIPIRLYPGLAIAQLFLHHVSVEQDERNREEAVPSSFSGVTEPRSGDPAGKKDRAVLKRVQQLTAGRI